MSGITNGLSVKNYVEFNRPLPNTRFCPGSGGPPVTDPNVLTRDLAKETPGIGSTIEPNGCVTWSVSEIAGLFVRLDNYPGSGTMEFFAYRNSDRKLLAHSIVSVPDHGGNPAWTSWWTWGYFTIGYFPSEIYEVGSYSMEMHSQWGNVVVFIDIVDTSDSGIIAKIKKLLIDPLLDEISSLKLRLSKIEDLWTKLEGWLIENLLRILEIALDAEVKK
jgi:hypothetical protein